MLAFAVAPAAFDCLPRALHDEHSFDVERPAIVPKRENRASLFRPDRIDHQRPALAEILCDELPHLISDATRKMPHEYARRDFEQPPGQRAAKPGGRRRKDDYNHAADQPYSSSSKDSKASAWFMPPAMALRW